MISVKWTGRIDWEATTATDGLQFVISPWPQPPSPPAFASTSAIQSELQRCSRCSYTGPPNTFPMRRTGVGYLKSCGNCVSKHVVRKAHKANKEPPPALLHTVPTMTLDAMITLIQSHRDKVFDFDAFVDLPEGTFSAGDHLYTRSNKLRDRIADVTFFHWKYVHA